MNSSEEFEQHRPHLFGIAYRMLGSAAEAEDVVQETYLRYRTVPPEIVGSPKALLSTIATRLSINQLHTARAQRETYIGPWLPEPVLTEADPAFAMAERSRLHESLSLAFLVLLEQLTPLERAVFLLREVFEYDYAEIAAIVEREEAAVRQLFSRAKKHIAAGRPRFNTSRETHRQLLDNFIRAVTGGDMEGLLHLLTADVTLWADGGRQRGAATRPIQGRDAVARFVMASTRFVEEPFDTEIGEVNGEPAVVLRVRGRAILVLMLEDSPAGVTSIRALGNPDKLSHV